MKNHRPRPNFTPTPAKPAAAAADETLTEKLDLPSLLEPNEDQIARAAYALWENSDHTHGHDQEHWFTAERELRSRYVAPWSAAPHASPPETPIH